MRSESPEVETVTDTFVFCKPSSPVVMFRHDEGTVLVRDELGFSLCGIMNNAWSIYYSTDTNH